MRGIGRGGTSGSGESGRVVDRRKGEEEGGARKGQDIRSGRQSSEYSNKSSSIYANKYSYSATDV
jgi:hypothetical protein